MQRGREGERDGGRENSEEKERLTGRGEIAKMGGREREREKETEGYKFRGRWGGRIKSVPLRYQP